MKRIVTVVAALALALPTLGRAQASTWSIDSSHSRTGFAVKHMVISDVRGEFGKTTGKVTLDEKDLGKSTVEATIDATTIDTREPKRDEHLRSADFLDVAKYPALTFKSTKVEAGKDGKVKVTGDLTLHGVTKPVTLDGELTGAIADPWGNTRRGFAATARINRKDFGLTWGKMLEAGPVVGDEVRIDIQAELIKDKPAAAK